MAWIPSPVMLHSECLMLALLLPLAYLLLESRLLVTLLPECLSPVVLPPECPTLAVLLGLTPAVLRAGALPVEHSVIVVTSSSVGDADVATSGARQRTNAVQGCHALEPWQLPEFSQKGDDAFSCPPL